MKLVTYQSLIGFTDSFCAKYFYRAIKYSLDKNFSYWCMKSESTNSPFGVLSYSTFVRNV